jgi:undecaprenyl diphosphate synthase
MPPEAIPRHIAIIMDGNGRWAEQRGLPRHEGHRVGFETVREIVRECVQLGVRCLTLYSFSIENWKRPKMEVDALMTLCAHYLVEERDEIARASIRLRQIGRRSGLPPNVLKELTTTEQLSASNSGMTLCLALNYGGRAEIVDAVRSLARRVQGGEIPADQIDEQAISDSLYTAGLPDLDLMIRTAGEMRISNFLLWQLSYAELYVTPVLWPDFRADDLGDAIREYARRDRRFGAV